jgi:flagellar motor switch protein FliG
MKAADKVMSESGIRKAAILVASLDEAAADLLLEQLSPRSAGLVRQAAARLGEIDGGRRQRVIDEFRRIKPMMPDRCPAGIDLDGPLASQLARVPADEAIEEAWPENCTAAADFYGQKRFKSPLRTVAEPVGSERPFGFLDSAEEAQLLAILSGERPQTIAMVLSHLPPARAGEVLTRLAPPLQAEAIRRLAESENTDKETLREVEQAMEARLSRQFATAERGPQTLARIIEACEGGVAQIILENLAAHDEPLAERLGRRVVRFEELAELNAATLHTVIRAAEPEVVQAALIGAPPRLIERIISSMGREEAKHLRRQLDCTGPIRLSDVEEAQRRLAGLAQRILRGGPHMAALVA